MCVRCHVISVAVTRVVLRSIMSQDLRITHVVGLRLYVSVCATERCVRQTSKTALRGVPCVPSPQGRPLSSLLSLWTN